MFNTEMIVKVLKGGKEDMTKKVIETVNGWYMENPKQKVELDDIVGLVKTDEPTDSVQLKKEAQLSICEKRIIELKKENEQLKQFKEKVFTLIEEELEEHPYLTLTEKWNPNCKNYHSCRGNHEKNVFYASRHTLLEKLMEKLSYD